MHPEKLLVLLTNDDGVESNGLLMLEEELAPLGTLVVVAPVEERSGVSHALTIHHPIRVREIAENHYSLTGTPVDCVLFAVQRLLPRLPDLVVSGINCGPNLGDDILYSGTVAAAREAALYRIPSLAVSLVTRGETPDYRLAAGFVHRLVREFYPERMPQGSFLNVNIPEGSVREYRFTRQGSKLVASSIQEKSDPRGRTYYWIGPDESEWVIESDTDYQAIKDHVVSITPLQRDQTDYRTLRWYNKEEEKIHI